MDNTIINAISSVGFPIVVTLYLLIRFQASMDNFSEKVDELIIEIRKGYFGGCVMGTVLSDTPFYEKCVSRTVPVTHSIGVNK